MNRRMWMASILAILGAAALAGTLARGMQPPDLESQVDAVFARWNGSTTPGCAVGVSVAERTVLERAYGMADLEHDVPNRPDTIFEAGSISKQVTAAAVLLLAQAGKLSLDEPARKYIPELPDYGAPLTIRHMLQHTSGLRDWGTIASLAGWPRTTRAHTHAHVLDIASRQRALNFPPGADWSYSNTGYNLSAIIVSRVAGESFAEFTRTRIFEPLEMSSTSWRDDHTRIVKHRSGAYAERGDQFHIDMPFENVHGNGGLLTTVGDLLRWNENFVDPTVGGPEFVREQQQRGVLADGREHDYALGLRIGHYKGVPQVSHSGSTAGYRAHLARFPDQHVSVAVLCNVSSGAASRYAYEVADLYLGGALRPVPAETPVALPAATLETRAGLYRSLKTGEPLRLIADDGALRAEDGPTLVGLSTSRFRMGAGGSILEFRAGGDGVFARVRRISSNGTSEEYERVEPVQPGEEELAAYVGRYRSDEVEVALTVAVDEGRLMMTRRPDTTITLKPVYRDAFAAPFGFVRFHRGADGRVSDLSIVTSRAWDVRFSRGVPPPSQE